MFGDVFLRREFRTVNMGSEPKMEFGPMFRLACFLVVFANPGVDCNKDVWVAGMNTTR